LNASEVLNADVKVIGRWVADGFRWWTEELAGLLNRSGREASRRQVRIEPDGQVQWLRDGAPIAPPRQPTSADVMLPANAVLVRTVPLPPLSRSDLRRLLLVDLDRLTPFDPEAVWLDHRVGATGEDGRQLVEVAVLPRKAAAAALDAAQAAGAKPTALRVAAPERPGALAFDFLPAVKLAERTRAARRRETLAWSAFALLLAANVAALVGRDVAATRALRDAEEAQRPTVALATALRRRVQDEEARRAAVLERRDRQEPLRIIEAVTRALPPPQWVQRLEWNGRTVRLVGYKRADFDLQAALRGSPLLTAPRTLNTETTPPSPYGEPFDVTADLDRPRS
jgi:general secretion pathway protein L